MFQPRCPTVIKPHYLGIFDIHVRKLASLLTFVATTLIVLPAILYGVNPTPYRLTAINVALLILLTLICVLLADKLEVPNYYLPWICVSLCLAFWCCLGICYGALWTGIDLVKEHPINYHERLPVLLILSSVFTFTFYCTDVTIRAFLYMKREVCPRLAVQTLCLSCQVPAEQLRMCPNPA